VPLVVLQSENNGWIERQQAEGRGECTQNREENRRTVGSVEQTAENREQTTEKREQKAGKRM
jgi:hypothetical protein